MATQYKIDRKKVEKLVKSGTSLGKVAEEMKVPVGVMAPHFYQAELSVGVLEPIEAKNDAQMAKKVKAARDNDKLRWERIAVAAGISVTQVKRLYEEAGGDLTSSYTGRGRNFSASNGESKGKSGKAGKAGKGGKSGAKAGKSERTTGRGGKSGGSAKAADKGGKGGGKTRRRADRRAKSGDPS